MLDLQNKCTSLLADVFEKFPITGNSFLVETHKRWLGISHPEKSINNFIISVQNWLCGLQYYHLAFPWFYFPSLNKQVKMIVKPDYKGLHKYQILCLSNDLIFLVSYQYSHYHSINMHILSFFVITLWPLQHQKEWWFTWRCYLVSMLICLSPYCQNCLSLTYQRHGPCSYDLGSGNYLNTHSIRMLFCCRIQKTSAFGFHRYADGYTLQRTEETLILHRSFVAQTQHVSSTSILNITSILSALWAR